jgi:hypothetical protein
MPASIGVDHGWDDALVAGLVEVEGLLQQALNKENAL